MKEKCLIVDGNNLLHSSYHVAQKMAWQIPNGAIFFFLRVLISILKKANYQKLLVVFDGGGTNFRKILFPHYKAQRASMPQELWEQLETLKSLLAKSQITYLQLIDCEADDLIATFIQKNKKVYPDTIFDIFTRDKDLLQLLNTNINVLKYFNGKITLYTNQQFFQEHNFAPKNYVDYLSLLGDQVDNIAGVKGVGPINAKKLIHEFQTVENIFQQIDNLPTTTRKLLEQKEKIVFTNKKIISLATDINLPGEIYQRCDFDWEKWKKNEELQKFCADNKFLSILKLLG